MLKETYALSYAQIGSLVLLSQITSSVIQPVFGLFSDRLSARWLMPVSLAIIASGFALIGLSSGYAWVVAGVIVMGLGSAAYHPEASKVAHFIGGTQKGRSMSIFALGGNIGLALGPLVMAAGVAMGGLRGPLIYVPITLVVIILFRVYLNHLYTGWSSTTPTLSDEEEGHGAVAPAPHEQPAPRRTVRRMAGRSAAAAMGILIVAITLRSSAHTTIITFIPLYFTTHLGNPEAYSSLLLTFFLVAGAVGTAVGGPVSDRLGARRVIVWSFLASIPFFAALPFLTTGVGPFILATIGGFTLIASFAVTTVLGQKLLPSRVGLASGLTLGFSVGTGGLGVTALGFVADHLGLSAAMLSISFLLVLGFIVSLLLPPDEIKPSPKDAEPAGS